MLSICCVLAERLKKFQVGRFLLGWLGWLSFKFLLGWQSFKVPSWLAKLQSSYLVGKASRFLLGWQSFTWFLLGWQSFFLLGWQSFTWFLLGKASLGSYLVGKASLGSYLAKLHLGWQWQWDQLSLLARLIGLSSSQARPDNSPQTVMTSPKMSGF